jgi:hypothetical protein
VSSNLPGRWHTREDSGLRLDRDFVWWHDGVPLGHPKLIELFNHSLVPSGDGRFQLRVGNDWCFVQVDDAAYRVTAVDVSPEGRVFLRLSDQTGEALAWETLRLVEEVLECRVKAGAAKARFTRDAQFTLGSYAKEEGGQLHFEVHGKRYPLAGTQTASA